MIGAVACRLRRRLQDENSCWEGQPITIIKFLQAREKWLEWKDKHHGMTASSFFIDSVLVWFCRVSCN